MKFRKRPLVVEAVQYFPDLVKIDGVCESRDCKHVGAHIHAAEGDIHVYAGDWVVTGVKDEKYPVHQNIFAETYEAVE